ncbi:MAG: hypothetical protein IT500_10395 [Rubrivivax sp.]|nr:hypothetical protein [Rubrivivax sp.]
MKGAVKGPTSGFGKPKLRLSRFLRCAADGHARWLDGRRLAVARPPRAALVQDGSKQWACKGKPLCRFFNDQKRGDKIGDGMNRNIWHVAGP